MDNQQPSPTAGTPIYQESQEKNAKWLWILIVLIIVAALAFAFFKKIGPFARFGSSEESIASPSPFTFSESSPSPSPSSEASSSSSLDRSQPKLRVLNGTSTSGLAATAKDFLESKGYKVASIGNAATRDFDRTTLTFKKGFEKFSDILTKDLSSKYSVTTSSDALEASDSADIEVTVGSK